VISENKTDFLYMNRENQWLGFAWEGLETSSDGSLRLRALPLLEGELPKELATLGTPDGPAGIARGPNRTLYFTDPSSNRMMMIGGCDGALSRVPCLGGEGTAPTRFSKPRGLWIDPRRRALFVTDSGNHRLQVFSLATFGLLEIWGQANTSAPPTPGSEPGLLNTPWTLVGDAKTNLYVVDYGNQRVQKFNALGEVIVSFENNLKAAGTLKQPSDIAIGVHGGIERLFIADASQKSIYVVNLDGTPVLDAAGSPVSFGSAQLSLPMGLTVLGNAVYVGDNQRRRVLTFKEVGGRFAFAGEAVGYQGPVAALASDNAGTLWVHSGAGLSPVKLAVDHGFSTLGVLWSQAIQPHNYPVQWHSLLASIQALEPKAHIQFFVVISKDASTAPAHPQLAANSLPPFSAEWQTMPADINDLFIGGPPALSLWIGAYFSGDGRSTPVVSQIRVEYDHRSYLSYLPAIYRRPSPGGDFLLRFLSLFESFFNEAEWNIAKLPALFDPQATPEVFLAWLASWLGLQLNEDWSVTQKRQAIANAYASYAKQGTVQGLRQAVKALTGVDVILEEPLLNTNWWALPIPDQSTCASSQVGTDTQWRAEENSILGYTTMLAAEQPQGAVVGTSAVLDRSHLITDAEFGEPLFSEVAHQFSVLVYRSQLSCDQTLARLKDVIEQEKPAHTSYHLCVIEPRLRIGFQARVGIDTVVAGPPASLRIGDEVILGRQSALGGSPPAKLGERSQVGISTRVG